MSNCLKKLQVTSRPPLKQIVLGVFDFRKSSLGNPKINKQMYFVSNFVLSQFGKNEKIMGQPMPISSNCFNIFLILCSEAEILTIELWQIFFKMEKKINKKWPWRPSSRKQPSGPNNNIPTFFAFRVFCGATPKTIANRPINGGGGRIQ